MKQDRKIIIITAPSGSGKTTIVKHLLASIPELAFSISACTRAPRNNERHGVDYYFITAAEFQQKIAANEFVEYEMVYSGKYYGTLKAELERIWQQAKTPLIDIDVKGALSIKERFPQQSLSLFIQPPSIDVLRQRLSTRGTETPQSLEERIQKATYEMTFASKFDKVVVNDLLEKALIEAQTLVEKFLKG